MRLSRDAEWRREESFGEEEEGGGEVEREQVVEEGK